MHPFRQLLRSRNFRLLWGAGGLSATGDQFDLIAFPWLVLLLTGDPIAVGTVIAVGNIPTVFFMLIGGGLVDRFSPRLIMQSSNLLRLILGATLAALILTGQIAVWLIYPLALLKGLADALYYPAQGALLPRIVAPGQLRQGNAVVQTTFQLSGILGPALAGALIALFSNGSGAAPAALSGLTGTAAGAAPDAAGLTGLALVFASVAAVFLLSALLLIFLRLETAAPDAADPHPGAAGIFHSIIQGIKFVRADAAMFILFILIAGIGLLIEGPVIVGIPILANSKMAQGALALGVIVSAYAGGALVGSVLAGLLPAPKRGLGLILLSLFALSGLLMMPFGFLTSMFLAAALALIIGIAGGYSEVLFTTWLQARTPHRMLGRVMSLLTIATVGLGPASNVIFGFLITFSLEWVFIGSGALLALICLPVLFRREIRTMQMPDTIPEQDDN